MTTYTDQELEQMLVEIESATAERILNEKRRHRDRPFDIQPMSSATLDDLDRRFFEEIYLPAAFAPEILEANDRNFEQRMAATKMIATADDPKPTVLGLLVLGKRTRDFLPGAYIQFLWIAGHALSDPIIDEQLIEGAIPDLLRRIDEKFVSHNRIAVDFTSAPVEQRSQPYPLAEPTGHCALRKHRRRPPLPVHSETFSQPAAARPGSAKTDVLSHVR